jgi:uncharacterized protein YcfJ
MKTSSRSALLPVIAGVLALAGASAAQAQDERGRVLSVTPVVEQITTPRQVCQDQVVSVPGRKSGAGALIGGIAGGAMGNAVGDGNGRAVATLIGLVGGAIVGDRIEGGGHARTQTVQQCHTQNEVENRTVAYNVVYEYAGREYRTQMERDPGRYVKLNVQPVERPRPAPQRQQMVYEQPAPAPAVIYIGGIRQVPDYRHHDRYERRDWRDNGRWDRWESDGR